MDTLLYTTAGSILKASRKKKASLKSLIYESSFNNIPKLTAFASELMKYSQLLEEIYTHIPEDLLLNDTIVEGKKEVALALLYEQLLGNKFGKNVAVRKVMLKYKAEIKTAVDKVVAAHNVKYLRQLTRSSSSKTKIKVPRYMRVNLIRSSPDCVIKQLQEEGWDFIGKMDSENFKDQVLSLKEEQFGLDPILSDVLVFPVGTCLFNHHLTLSGTLIQQDMASCIPAHVLNPPPGSVVLDCCAAPGNKTSHVISLMGDTGRVIAMDRDIKRMNTMSRMLEKVGASSVQLIHQDFLTLMHDSEDAKSVQYILVDPSCSGSGMLGVQEGRDIYDTDKERLQTLSRFQITILKHALRFPNVQRVVYSTCSVHEEENEQVVEQVMSNFSHKFKFVTIFPGCNHCRGLDGYPQSKHFLRLVPEKDLTQGFFVACFERRTQDVEHSVKQTGNVAEIKTRNETCKPTKQIKCSEDEVNTKTRKTKKRKISEGNEIIIPVDERKVKSENKQNLDGNCEDEINKTDIRAKSENSNTDPKKKKHKKLKSNDSTHHNDIATDVLDSLKPIEAEVESIDADDCSKKKKQKKLKSKNSSNQNDIVAYTLDKLQPIDADVKSTYTDVCSKKKKHMKIKSSESSHQNRDITDSSDKSEVKSIDTEVFIKKKNHKNLESAECSHQNDNTTFSLHQVQPNGTDVKGTKVHNEKKHKKLKSTESTFNLSDSLDGTKLNETNAKIAATDVNCKQKHKKMLSTESTHQRDNLLDSLNVSKPNDTNGKITEMNVHSKKKKHKRQQATESNHDLPDPSDGSKPIGTNVENTETVIHPKRKKHKKLHSDDPISENGVSADISLHLEIEIERNNSEKITEKRKKSKQK